MAGTGPQNQPDEALVDLLIKQVTEGLSAAEQRELDVQDSEVASALARDFERAAAAVTLAGTPSGDALPPALAARIEADARAFFASAASASAPTNVVELNASRDAQAEERHAPRGAALGWWAAAACLMLAVWGWLRSPPSAPPIANVPVVVAPPVVPTPKVEPKPPTPAEAREAMLARSDALKVTIGATKEPAAAGMSADVVWDPATQQGYLHVTGLAHNDPKLHQYQLWIFDGQRDQRYPVDAGVFDMPENSSEVVLPIRAALLVHDAKAFAVTIEKPGGAVVSARDHVVGLGKAG